MHNYVRAIEDIIRRRSRARLEFPIAVASAGTSRRVLAKASQT